MDTLSPMVLIVFNGVGVMLTISAVALVVHFAVKVSSDLKNRFISLLRGFGLIGFSFFWTLIFGQLVSSSRLLTVQSVLLSVGMAFLVYSARQIYEIYEREKLFEVKKQKVK